MKQPSRKNNLHDEGYIPFKLGEINKIKVLDCILILNDGSIFFGRSFDQKRLVLEKFALIHHLQVIKK